jgi:glycyl-tRNA synthetase beta chain
MQQNQKYFAVTDADGRLRNRFLLVANLVSQDPQKVVQGNERVIRARLSDAKFFYDQDRLKPLADRLASLDAVIYHNKIGSQGQRIQRLEQLARSFATALHVDSEDAARAARLAKADLATDMVGEFPELQGVMGQYYALHEGESKQVAAAIEGHYHPRFAGDTLASNGLGLAVALADKTELLVGIWGIGLVPSGEKDPFGLRRAALGILRMLIETPVELSLSQLVAQGQKGFEKVAAVKPETEAVLNFLLDRARGYLKDQGHPAEAIEAVLAECPDKPWQWLPRLQAVNAFLNTPHAAALCAANKRIGNILKKASPDDASSSVKSELLVEANEKALAQALAQTAPQAEALAAAGKYQESLESLALLKAPVDAFFEAVMVNADDLALRANRIALLGQAHRAMNQVADLARLAVNT